MPYLGVISLYAACALTMVFSFIGIFRLKALGELARRANLASIVAIIISTLALVWSFVGNDFRLAYVARNSARNLPLIYKVSALWAGQSGSLLLWLLVVSLFSLAIQKMRCYREQELDIRLNVVINLIRLLFMFLLLFVTPPFEFLADPLYNGSGLNPMLQSLGMVVHPPLLFIGFSGFLIPFALAVVSLWSKDDGDGWLRLVRPWALFAWFFLTAGIVTGGHWAYNELGWGGYWAWDPVENASLLPWLTGTALLHTLMLNRDDTFRKLWSYILIVLTFALTIFGTYLTRSGVLDSVHAFSGGILGQIFLVVLLAILIVSIFLGWSRKACLVVHEKTDKRRSWLSLGTATWLSTILLLLLCTGVFLGTMFPLFSRIITGREIVLDASFYNQLTVPLFLPIFFLLGLTPVLPREGIDLGFLMKNLWFSLVLATAIGLYIFFQVGGGLGAAVAFAIAVFGLATHLREALGSSAKIKRARLLVHIGLLVMLAGVTGSSVYVADFFLSVEPGQTFGVGMYQAEYSGLNTRYGSDRYTVGTTLNLFRAEKPVGKLTSEKTFWENRKQPSTQVGIFSTFSEDIYLNLAGWEGQRAQLHLQRLALVGWIWFGSWLVYLAVILILVKPSVSFGKVVKLWRKKTF